MSFASGTVVAGWSAPQTPVTVGETLFRPKTMEQSSWIVSIYVIGAIVGALPASRISKRIGCKKCLQLLAIPMALGWLTIMVSVNYVNIIVFYYLSSMLLFYRGSEKSQTFDTGDAVVAVSGKFGR